MTPARSRRVKAKKISYIEFADTVKEAEELTREVECGAKNERTKDKVPGREHPQARRDHEHGWAEDRASE